MRIHPLLVATLLASTASSAFGQAAYYRYPAPPSTQAQPDGGTGPEAEPNAPPAGTLSASAVGFSGQVLAGDLPSGGIEVTGASPGAVTYSATGFPPGVSLSPTGRLVGRFEGTGSYTAKVTVTDALGRKSLVEIAFEVLPSSAHRVTLAEAPPSFVQEGSNATFAATTDLADAAWTLTGASPGSSVSPQGRVTLVGSDVGASTTYAARLTATKDAASAHADFSYGVVPATAGFGTFGTVRPSGRFGVPVTTSMDAGGTWTFEGPTGFADVGFTPSGSSSSVMAGTAPSVPATYALTARFTAANGATATALGSQVVSDAFSLASLGGPYVVHSGGQALSTDAPVPRGLLGSVSYALAGTPFAGTRFEDGRLLGNPTETGTRSFTVTALDSRDSASASGELSVTVVPPLAFTQQPQDALVFAGNGVAVTVAAAPAIGSLTYRLIAASGTEIEDLAVPCPGLGFSRQTGAITGTANVSCSLGGLTVRASDGSGASVGSSAFSLVGATPTTSVESVSTDVVEGGIIEFQASSNIPNATFSIASSTPPLPGYVTMSSQGLVRVRTGDHGATTDYSVVVRASNGTMTRTATVPVKVRASTVAIAGASVHSGRPFSLAAVVTNEIPDGATWSIGGIAGVTASGGPGSYVLSGTAVANTGTTVVNTALNATRTAPEAPAGGTAAKTSGGTAIVSVYPDVAISGTTTGTVNYTVGTQYAFSFDANHVIQAAEWSLSGTLPTGLTPSVSGKTYTISGNPSQVQDREVTITLKDTHDGSVATRTIRFVGSAPATAATLRPATVNGSAGQVDFIYDTSRTTLLSINRNETITYVFPQAVNVDTYCIDVQSTAGDSMGFTIQTAEKGPLADIYIPNGDLLTYQGTISPETGRTYPGSSTSFTVKNTQNKIMRIYAFRLGVGGTCAP
jgi:hypothetical protein